jgi:hypothetical protein
LPGSSVKEGLSALESRDPQAGDPAALYIDRLSKSKSSPAKRDFN